MAKSKKKRADHNENPLKAEGGVEDVIKVAMDSSKEKTELTPEEIILAIKKNHFGSINSREDLITTFEAVFGYFPKHEREDVRMALLEIEGSEMIDSLSSRIKIPGKHFK